MEVRKALESGAELVGSAEGFERISSMVTQMIGVGEQTGAMDAMCKRSRTFTRTKWDAAVKDLLRPMNR